MLARRNEFSFDLFCFFFRFVRMIQMIRDE